MRITAARILAVILTAFFVALLLALPGCAPTQRLPVATHADSLLTAAGLPGMHKLVVRGNLTLQVAGPGSTQTSSQADNRKAGQRQGSAATAPAAQSGNASKRSSGASPWWYVLATVAGAVGWEALRYCGLLPDSGSLFQACYRWFRVE